jgi:hypothetical protein
MRLRTVLALASAIQACASPAIAVAGGPPVALSVVDAEPGADPGLVKRIREAVAARRAIREDLALPPAESVSTEQAAMDARAGSIRLALARARRAESEASWDGCVREAAGAMSDATLVLARVNDLALLRDLHVQIGACLTLAESGPSARPHFVSAALLDEAPPRAGEHREEAEKAQAEARAEVLARARGKVRIETMPPGAEVWIDGRKAPGATPLEVDARLGDHFVTIRRFRFDPHTELVGLTPSGVVSIALDPARRPALRDQLAALAAGAAPPSAAELRLARAVWSRAEQLVTVAPTGAGACRVEVLDASTGQPVRAVSVSGATGDDVLRRAVCDALGETCEVKSRGVPWYVWPIAGAAVIGAVVSTAFVVNSKRSFVYTACAPGMVCN